MGRRAKQEEDAVEAAKQEVQAAESKVQAAESKVQAAESKVQAAKQEVQTAEREMEEKVENAQRRVLEAEALMESAETGNQRQHASFLCEFARENLASARLQRRRLDQGFEDARQGLEDARQGLRISQRGLIDAQREVEIVLEAWRQSSKGVFFLCWFFFTSWRIFFHSVCVFVSWERWCPPQQRRRGTETITLYALGLMAASNCAELGTFSTCVPKSTGRATCTTPSSLPSTTMAMTCVSRWHFRLML